MRDEPKEEKVLVKKSTINWSRILKFIRDGTKKNQNWSNFNTNSIHPVLWNLTPKKIKKKQSLINQFRDLLQISRIFFF